MSMSPNNPFDNPQNDPGFGYDQVGTPTQSKSGKGCLIGCGVVGLLGLVLCCGGGVFLVNFGVGQLGKQLTIQIKNNPAVVENVGEIESLEVNWGGTVEEAQQSGESDSGLIFDIKGSKGSAKLMIKDDGGGAGNATLILQDGTRIPIDFEGPSANPDAMDLDLDDIDTGDIDTGDIDTGNSSDSDSGVETGGVGIDLPETAAAE